MGSKDKVNSNNKRLSSTEKKMIWVFLIYSFLIAWGSETTIIVLYRLNLLDEKLMQILYYVLLGAGCGMAPAYAAFIVERKYASVTWKGFLKKIFRMDSRKRSFTILILFGAIQFGACVLQEQYTGNPWYLFILFMPLMIYGGGGGNWVAGGFPTCTSEKISIPGSRSHRRYCMERLAPAFMVHSQLITECI